MSTPPSTAADGAQPAEAAYTIDELASVAHVPSRTIRFYQSRGALMAPEIRGRVAYYGPGHVKRLELIAQLQDRGLRIDAIRDLLASIDRGDLDIAEWLGVEQQVQAPWANDRARTMSEEELYEVAGARRHGLLSDLVRARIVERHGDVYLLRSPALLSIALKLEAAGIDLETAAQASQLVRKAMSRVAADLVDLFVKRTQDGAVEPRDLGALFETLRPLGTEAVRIIFGRAMERSLRELLESGRMAKLPSKARRAKKR